MWMQEQKQSACVFHFSFQMCLPCVWVVVEEESLPPCRCLCAAQRSYAVMLCTDEVRQPSHTWSHAPRAQEEASTGNLTRETYIQTKELPEGAALQAQADGTINSSRPEHTKRTQGNAEQHKATHAGQAEPTQPKQHQQTKNQHRGSRTLLETTNDRKPKPTHQPQATPIETTTRGLPQPHRPSQPNLPRTTLDPTRHPRQHRTRTGNVVRGIPTKPTRRSR